MPRVQPVHRAPPGGSARRSALRGVLGGLLLVLAGGGEGVTAQTRGFERPPSARDQLLELPVEPPSKPEPAFTLPPLALPPEESQRLPAAVRVPVSRIELEGNTVFSEEELRALVQPFEGRELDYTDLEALRVALTRFYVERGYINSGALVPDQRVEGGVITVRILEGVLSRIELRGNRSLGEDYLLRRLAPPPGAPLNLPELQERLRLLLEHPLVKRVDAEVLPGERRGEAVLRATVEENLPWQFDLEADNAISPSLGSAELSVVAAHRSLSGAADPLVLDAAFAEGLRTFRLSYERPFTPWDTTLLLWAESNDSDVVEQPFDEINVESRSQTASVGLRQPLLDTPADKLSLSASLERRHSETFLLGIPFSFSPGVEDGQSDVTVLRLTQEWVRRAPHQVLALRSTFSVGLDFLGATVNAGLPDSRFFAWLGQAQWARRFPWGGQVVLRADGQVSADALLPIEKYAVGGLHSVRGYRQDLLVRDSGFAASAEYRHRLWADETGRFTLDLAPFLDVGGAWNVSADTPNPEVVSSIGLGLRAEAGSKLQGRLYWGHALDDSHEEGEDIQDQGLHFQLSGQFF